MLALVTHSLGQPICPIFAIAYLRMPHFFSDGLGWVLSKPRKNKIQIRFLQIPLPFSFPPPSTQGQVELEEKKDDIIGCW